LKKGQQYNKYNSSNNERDKTDIKNTSKYLRIFLNVIWKIYMIMKHRDMIHIVGLPLIFYVTEIFN